MARDRLLEAEVDLAASAADALRCLDELAHAVQGLGRSTQRGGRSADVGPTTAGVEQRIAQVMERLGTSRRSLSNLARWVDRQVHAKLTELQEADRFLAELAITDPLTNLVNRRGFELELDHWLAVARRKKRSLCLVLLALDDFERYKAIHGHGAGNAMLCAVATMLLAHARDSDLVVRWGGDEFCVLLPDTEREGALVASRRIVSSLGAMAVRGAGKTSAALRVSAGLAIYPDQAGNGAGLLARAHAALSQAKAQGGGCTVHLAEGHDHA